MSATEVGQICTSLFLTYFAGRGHRPRWIACGNSFLYMLAIDVYQSRKNQLLFNIYNFHWHRNNKIKTLNEYTRANRGGKLKKII